MICGNKIGGNRECKTYVIEGHGVEVIGVVVDELEMFDACCDDVKSGKKFACDTGVNVGMNDSPCCCVTNGVHEVYPDVEFLLTLPERDQWDYTELQCMMAPKDHPYAIDKVVIDNVVYSSDGTKLADVTKDATNKTIRFNITNNTADIYLLYFFVCKEED